MNDVEKMIQEIRKKIDAVDKKIQELLRERANLVLNVIAIKKKENEKPVVYRPEREAAMLREIMERDCAPLKPEAMAAIFKSIISESRALQQKIKVAFLGPEGTFSQAASFKHFGHAIEGILTKDIHHVFKEVEFEKAHYGVVPIENTIGGLIMATFHELIQTPLKICGEVELPIAQHLLVDPNDKTDIQTIYSHHESFAQCADWLNQHFPNADKIAVSSNAKAAQLAKQEKGAAAIAGDPCVEMYGLVKYAENIMNVPNNTTRFLVMGHQITPPSGDDRTTLIVTTQNQPGALEHIIQCLTHHKINMTFIKSHPHPAKNEHYLFFMDVDVHQEESRFQSAFDELQKEAVEIKLLGSYPKALVSSIS